MICLFRKLLIIISSVSFVYSSTRSFSQFIKFSSKMEKILKLTLLVMSILLLTKSVSSGITAIVEGITVQKEGGSLLCDTLECPMETDVCRVAKIFDRKDEHYFIRIRKCIDANGVVLKKEKLREPIGSFNQSITVTMERGEQSAIIFSDPKPEDE